MEGIGAGATWQEAKLLFRKEIIVEQGVHHPAIDDARQKLEVHFQERYWSGVLNGHFTFLGDGENEPFIEQLGENPPSEHEVEL